MAAQPGSIYAQTDESNSRLTNASCTAPQKHVAVASSLVDQPSLAWPARGKLVLLSLVSAMAMCFCRAVKRDVAGELYIV